MAVVFIGRRDAILCVSDLRVCDGDLRTGSKQKTGLPNKSVNKFQDGSYTRQYIKVHGKYMEITPNVQ